MFLVNFFEMYSITRGTVNITADPKLLFSFGCATLAMTSQGVEVVQKGMSLSWPSSSRCRRTVSNREFGNRQRRRRKTKSLIRVVYKSAHTLLDFNCLLKYNLSFRSVLSNNSQRIHNKQPKQFKTF